MNKRLALRTAASIGAGAMHILDPDVVKTIHESANNTSSLRGHPVRTENR